MKAIVRLPNSSSLAVPSANPSRSGGFHCWLCAVPKKCLRRSLASTNCLEMVGKSNPSVRSLWTLRSIMLLRRCWDIYSRSQVGFDASDGRKGPFPSCSGNRDCEIDPHQFVYLTKHTGSQWCSGKHVCKGANRGDLGGNVRAAVQKIWQHTELPFKLPHVNVFVRHVVNFRRDCTGFEFRITKDGTLQSQLMLLYC